VYLELGLESPRKNVLEVILKVLVHHFLDLLLVGQFLYLLRVLFEDLLVVGDLRLDQLILLLGLKVGLVIAILTHRVYYVASVGIFVKFFIWSDPPPANLAAFQRLQYRLAVGRCAETRSYLSLLQLVLMDDEFIALAAEHVLLALRALPNGLPFL